MGIMKNEIFSEPEVLKNTLNNNLDVIKAIAAEIKQKNITNIETVARGSSNNAALCFKYACEIMAGIPVMEYHPSITTMYKSEVRLNNNLLIAISQSGKSIDTLAVLNHSRKNGAITVAVTNDPESPLAKAAHYSLNLACGEELSVASAKSYIAELLVLYMLAIEISGKDVKAVLYSIPSKIQEVIDRFDEIHLLAERLKDYENTIILTRGIMQGVGKEISLKYIECCYNLCHYFSINDFLHGPLSIIDDRSNVLLIAPDSELKEDFMDITLRLKLLGAKVTVISDIKELLHVADDKLEMPHCNNLLTPSIIYSVAGHLLVNELAYLRGINPDSPRNMKKLVITK